jgi:hypothetical protein
MLPSDLNLNPEEISVLKSPTQWKALVVECCAQVLQQWNCTLAETVSVKHAPWSPDYVAIVTKDHMLSLYQSKKWQKVIDQIVVNCKLNREQEWAYHIIANHSCSDCPEQLKMHIAGMAGTGKTQVLFALTQFFFQKGEAHHLVIVAPTGSADALLGDSTYYYMFGINSDGHKTTRVQLAQIKSHLQGVDYVFLDEVSMLSCQNMYKISERLTTINNNDASLFGGLNMIFAGDFAQLPPPIGKENTALYSRTVSLNVISL